MTAAGRVPADCLVWYVRVTGSDKAGWSVRGWIEHLGLVRDADGLVEDYVAGESWPIFEAEGFESVGVSRAWAEAILGGPISWSGAGYAGSWRGFRDVTVGAEIGDGVVA